MARHLRPDAIPVPEGRAVSSGEALELAERHARAATEELNVIGGEKERALALAMTSAAWTNVAFLRAQGVGLCASDTGVSARATQRDV